MKTSMLPLLLALFATHATAQKSPNYVVNGDFEKGLQGWTAQGDAAVSSESPVGGKASLRLGPGKGSVHQRYEVPGLRILLIGGAFKPSAPEVSAVVKVRCFDTNGRLLMSLDQAFDPKKASDPKGVGAWIYFKTHAYTAYVDVSFEKPAAKKGTVLVDDVQIQDDDRNRVVHAPQCDLDHYMQPIWEGDTVYDETILLFSSEGGPAKGQLLYNPTRITSVRDLATGTDYVDGKDFRVEGRELVALPDSKIPVLQESELPKGDFPWMDLYPRHLRVTYTHADTWTGPIPTYEGDHLPETMAKLRSGKPLTIVTLGDSITLGINVSSFLGRPPYMPTWADLFAGQLRKVYKNEKIKLYNTGLGGMTAQWGADNARTAIASLNPDLVTIAFGMNDFWSVSPAEFGSAIKSTIDTIRRKRPKVEFILISTMKFDPAYTSDPTYVGHIEDYAKELRSLVGEGVRLLDMTAISDALYKAKGAKSLTTDPMHPDDFLARWYAQGLGKMLEMNR